MEKEDRFIFFETPTKWGIRGDDAGCDLIGSTTITTVMNRLNEAVKYWASRYKELKQYMLENCKNEQECMEFLEKVKEIESNI